MVVIVTKGRLGFEKEYNLDTNLIRLTNRSGVGINLYNLLKIPKSEKIIKVYQK